jgi:hypothetical protein
MALGAALLAGCTSSTATDPGGAGAPAGPGIPLASSTVTGSTTWVTLAMGHLADPLNTFWQLLSLGGATSWQLTTPPGVASNGGLVVSSPAQSVLAGFVPSQQLHFSPLAHTVDQGSSWQPGLLPAGLARVPDGLVEGATESLALLSIGGGSVVASTGDLATWTPVTSAAVLRRQPALAGCHLHSLTAVTLDAGGSPLVGGSCAQGGRAGLFLPSSTGWMSAGPGIPGVSGGPTEVIRLDQTVAGTAALVSAGRGPSARLFGLWSTNGLRTWTVSAGLPLGTAPLRSTGVTADGGFVITFGTGGSGLAASTLAPAAPRWRSLSRPPTGTTSVTGIPGGGFDALDPRGTTLSVYALGGTRWSRVQKLQVDIPYGSSS